MWNPPEEGITDEEQDKWKKEHRTPANIDTFTEQVADNFSADSTVYNLLRKTLSKGLEHLDNDEVAILFNYFDIAPSLESYVENLRDSDDPQLD